MKVAMIIDDYLTRTHGTAMTAVRFSEELKKRGHEVRIVSIGVEGENMFALKKRYIPIVCEVAARQDFYFAKPDKKILKKAIEGCDVVHTFLPLKLSKVARKIAKKMGVPFTASFHLHPDNILYGAKLRWLKFISAILFRRWRRKFYRKVDNIHCPSEFSASELIKRKYKSKLHIISNGVNEFFQPLPAAKERGEIFNIISVGRLAPEKRQDLILRAVAMSKYKEKIQLSFAGRGPEFRSYQRLAKKLKLKVEFGFYNSEELLKKLHNSDLYIHAADVEIEGISCIEAFTSGVNCLISDAKKSATSKFAVDPACIFKAGNAKELAAKIDFFIENPSVSNEIRHKYIEQSKLYRIKHSVDKAEEMFRQAISDRDAKVSAAKNKKAKRMKKKISGKKPIRRFFALIFYYAVVVPVLFLIAKFCFRLKIKGKKNIKKLYKRNGIGAVTISNHIHYLDCSWVAYANFPKKAIYTSLPSNFKMPVAGQLVNILGAVPTPSTHNETKVFFSELSKKIKKGKIVHFYPEGELALYDDNLREFKRGAFYLAVISSAPVVPYIFTYRKKRNPKCKPKITLNILKPIYPNGKLLKKDAIKDLQNRCFEAMKEVQSAESALRAESKK